MNFELKEALALVGLATFEVQDDRIEMSGHRIDTHSAVYMNALELVANAAITGMSFVTDSFYGDDDSMWVTFKDSSGESYYLEEEEAEQVQQRLNELLVDECEKESQRIEALRRARGWIT